MIELYAFLTSLGFWQWIGTLIAFSMSLCFTTVLISQVINWPIRFVRALKGSQPHEFEDDLEEFLEYMRDCDCDSVDFAKHLFDEGGPIDATHSGSRGDKQEVFEEIKKDLK